MTVHRPDILIIGAGVLGSATAWHLSQKNAGEITVIDLDLAGTYSSSELNAGGCRATWWNPLNVELSWHAMKFYKTIADEIQFFQKGYLFLYNQTRWKTALEKKSLYQSLNIPVEYLKVSDIAKHLPEFENLKGVAGATYSPKDGLIDPHLLREFYRIRAKEKGVHFVDHVYVQGMKLSGKKIHGVEGLHWEDPASPGEELLETILTRHQIPDLRPWKKINFEPKAVVNCTGAWFPVTSRLYQVPSPVKPVRRQISLFSTHDEDFSDRGMMVDSSGLYMHPEGSHTGLVLSGYSNRDEKPGYRFDYDGEKFFDRKIWLRLYRRGNRKHFEAVKHVRGWAGLYAVGPDNTGILWRVADFDNLYELGAATGRGVMQSYSLGLALAELITKGKFETLDASRLTGARFAMGQTEPENLDI
jgi:glycine/D-amino acid oxidase-like deaminating enzyme